MYREVSFSWGTQSRSSLTSSVMPARARSSGIWGREIVVHPADTVHGAEQLDGAVIGAVGLQALKDLLGVVEHLGRRIDLEGSIGDDAGVVPALAGVIVHDEHMIGHALAEHQSGGLGLLLQSLSAGDLDLLHNGTAS